MRIAEILIEPRYPIKTSGEIVIEGRVASIKKYYGKKYKYIILKRDDFNVGSILNAIFDMARIRLLRTILIFLLGVLLIPKINRILKSFEIIIINGYFTAVFLLPYLIINKIKSIYCPHTQVRATKINAWLMNFFDAIVFLSDYNRKQLLRKSKKLANKAYVIYNFVGERAQNRKKRRSNGFECLFVGRAVDVKRPWLFIDGVAEAAKRNKNIKSTMIVASGPLESKIKELIGTVEKKQRYKINLHLNLKKVEVKGMYKNADVFVFTSTPEEGQGIVLMEAMQHGLPIICTDHPKFKEFLGDAALYFTDKKSLAEKILKLAQDKKLYREYQIRSSQRFRVFSSKETAKKWVGLFNKLYAEKNKIEGDDIKGKY